MEKPGISVSRIVDSSGNPLDPVVPFPYASRRVMMTSSWKNEIQPCTVCLHIIKQNADTTVPKDREP